MKLKELILDFPTITKVNSKAPVGKKWETMGKNKMIKRIGNTEVTREIKHRIWMKLFEVYS